MEDVLSAEARCVLYRHYKRRNAVLALTISVLETRERVPGKRSDGSCGYSRDKRTLQVFNKGGGTGGSVEQVSIV